MHAVDTLSQPEKLDAIGEGRPTAEGPQRHAPMKPGGGSPASARRALGERTQHVSGRAMTVRERPGRRGDGAGAAGNRSIAQLGR